MQMPISAPDASCSMCGGTLRPYGAAANRSNTAAAAPAPRSDIAEEEVQRQADAIISAILPADLLGGLGNVDKPADEDVVASLPLVKIEPYVSLRVTRDAPDASDGPDELRKLRAEAAERRAAATAATTTPAPPPAMTTGADAAAACVGAAATPVPPPPAPVGTQAASSSSEPPPAAAAAGLDFKGTSSAFGTPLADVGEEGVSAALVLAEPRDGAADFANAAELKGKLVLMWRGGCSFVDKVRRAQAAGAAAACVVQTEGQKWPFSMSDTTGKGSDLLLPSLMIRPADGAKLLEELEAAAKAGEACHAVARAHDHQTSCAVCLQEMMAEEMAVRLPCAHLFHEDCVRQWLKKNHTCPCCRTALPPKEAPRREVREGEASEALRTWADFAVPRGSAPMPSTGMFS